MLDIYDPCWAASDGSAKSIANTREQTRKQPVCSFDSTYSIFIARILLLFCFFFGTESKPGEPADDVDRPPFLFFFWNHVWSCKYLRELMAVGSPQEALLQTTGVCTLSCYEQIVLCSCSEDYTVKKKISLCLWSVFKMVYDLIIIQRVVLGLNDTCFGI